MKWIDWLRNHFGQSNIKSLPTDPAPILAVFPFQADRKALETIAKSDGRQVDFSPTLDGAVELLNQGKRPIVILDRDLPSSDWRQALVSLTKAAPASVILLASSTAEDSLWEEVVERGGYEILQKPFEPAQVSQTFDFAWRYWKLINKCP